jgi:hypothetical protein
MTEIVNWWALIPYLAVLGGLGWLALAGIARFHRWLHREP